MAVFTGQMFVGSEVQLDVSFDVARARLLSLLHDRTLLTASQDAYSEGVAGLARVGPPGPGMGMSRLVEVKFQQPVAHDDSVLVPLRWEAIGPGGGLFPALDADLTLVPAGDAAAVLRLAAAYRPPLEALGAQLDRVTLHQVAIATVQEFLGRVSTAITYPAPVTSPTRANGHRGASPLPPDAEAS
ncbi:MAG TPA: hypothetical protein VMA73_08350 [Streptosporangiaceae bacterium]|nr:hypothetical protein [Streptosporangiaceae bacterium]